ncbi:MAG: cellulase family glycosylhydrolase [Myxococcales bacterium]|nr:cellulase family glycosylhydrolase [Myxococcales bacterium]
MIARLAIAAAVLFLVAGPAQAASDLRAEGRFFKDAQGRVVILRGVNMAGDSKVPPFTPITSAELLDPLADWGMNIIRFLFTWEAYEPEPGVYDESYLDYYEQVLDWAAERGIWVILDIHQDTWSRYANSGCGEGFPAWAVTAEVPLHAPDNSVANCEAWSIMGLLDPEQEITWDRFYNDTEGVRTRYLAMMDRLAERFGAHPALAGYDLLNEPFGLEDTEILPLYEDAAAVVRARDPDGIIFVSPSIVTSVGLPSRMDRPSFDNFAFAPHFYDALVALTRSYFGQSFAKPFDGMARVARGWGVPLLLGEFGGPGVGTNIPAAVDALYRQIDVHLAGATQWVYTPGWDPVLKDGWNGEDFSITDDTGTPRVNFRVRPYARRVAGEPTRMAATYAGFLSVNSVVVEWNHDPATGETEIFAPVADLFPNGYKIERSGADLTCAYDADERLYTCASPTAGPKRVKIRACVNFLGICF